MGPSTKDLPRHHRARPRDSKATKVTRHPRPMAAFDDTAYAATADGWPRILSRLKTLIETGTTFKPP